MNDHIRNGHNRTGRPGPETEEKYRRAVEMYAATDLSRAEISRRCGVSASGLYGHIRKYHRHLLLARNGIECSPEEAVAIGMSPCRGQKPGTHAKYKDAIAACDSMEYIEYNVSQIARLFGVNPSGLGNQLRAHYPELVERRERERRRRGLADNQRRGVRTWCREQYAGAVELLRTTELTLPEAAEKCGVSFSGLLQHIWFYHKDLIETRSDLRERAKSHKRIGHVTGTGRRHEPMSETREHYREAVRLYRETPLTIKAICKQLGLNPHSFSSYLHIWHREDAFARRGAEYCEGLRFSDTKSYKRSTAAKYAGAIARLKESGLPTARVAAEFGLHPECFRQYLKEHEPELHTRQGMVKAQNGCLVSARSMEKYGEAIRLYETTDEPLKSIARRLDIRYPSLGGFVRRNFPELIERHKESYRQAGMRTAE